MVYRSGRCGAPLIAAKSHSYRDDQGHISSSSIRTPSRRTDSCTVEFYVGSSDGPSHPTWPIRYGAIAFFAESEWPISLKSSVASLPAASTMISEIQKCRPHPTVLCPIVIRLLFATLSDTETSAADFKANQNVPTLLQHSSREQQCKAISPSCSRHESRHEDLAVPQNTPNPKAAARDAIA